MFLIWGAHSQTRYAIKLAKVSLWGRKFHVGLLHSLYLLDRKSYGAVEICCVYSVTNTVKHEVISSRYLNLSRTATCLLDGQ